MFRERRDLLRAAAGVGAAALAGCSGATRSNPDEQSPSLRVPSESLVGEPVRIRLADFDPTAPVGVEASATDARGVEFAADWSPYIGDDGSATVTSANAEAERGDETETGRDDETETRTPGDQRVSEMGPGLDAPDPTGIQMLLDRLTPRTGSPSPSNFVVGDQHSVTVRFTAESKAGGRASATATRVYADPAVTRHSVSDSTLVGWLYAPPGDGPHPGVLALHGSEAVVPNALSRVLATHGYATLALQYVGAEDQPESLDGVPLEYFERATRWLTDRSDVRDDRVGFVGVSRGVEAALLSAAAFPGRSAVVGYSGGGVLGPGTDESANEVEGWEAAWTRDGDPVASADPVRSVFSAVEAVRYDCTGADCASAVRERVSASALRRAVAPVEEIDGPVLLLAGGNDYNWPASALAALAIDRLDRRGHDAPFQLRTYEKAGHVFGLPYQSYAGEATGPRYGGTPAANADAAADSWPLVRRFLRVGLGRGRPADSI